MFPFFSDAIHNIPDGGQGLLDTGVLLSGLGLVQ